MYRTSINISLEESRIIIQYLQTLSDEIWQNHEKELLKKLSQFCHTQTLITPDDAFEDQIPF